MSIRIKEHFVIFVKCKDRHFTLLNANEYQLVTAQYKRFPRRKKKETNLLTFNRITRMKNIIIGSPLLHSSLFHSVCEQRNLLWRLCSLDSVVVSVLEASWVRLHLKTDGFQGVPTGLWDCLKRELKIIFSIKRHA